jgi:hypothetical protein
VETQEFHKNHIKISQESVQFQKKNIKQAKMLRSGQFTTSTSFSLDILSVVLCGRRDMVPARPIIFPLHRPISHASAVVTFAKATAQTPLLFPSRPPSAHTAPNFKPSSSEASAARLAASHGEDLRRRPLPPAQPGRRRPVPLLRRGRPRLAHRQRIPRLPARLVLQTTCSAGR